MMVSLVKEEEANQSEVRVWFDQTTVRDGVELGKD
jgi:hypothetical protein